MLNFNLLMLLLLLIEGELRYNMFGVVSFDETHLYLLYVSSIILVDNGWFINGGMQSTCASNMVCNGS